MNCKLKYRLFSRKVPAFQKIDTSRNVNNITREVIRMEDLQHLKVVQHNDLIKAVAKMDKIPLKFFELAVSCLDSVNPPKDNTVYISKEALFSFFKAESSDKDRYYRFRNHLNQMRDQARFSIRYKDGKKIKEEIISVISKISWNNYEDTVLIKFTEDVMPYLVDLKRDFTQYNVVNLSDMSSRYSVILYKWLVMNYKQYKKYENQSNKNPIIDIDELREMTETQNKYKEIGDFERKVLVCVDEISRVSDLNVTYEKIRKGRRIGAIQFFISEKPIKPAAPLDEEYLEKRETKEEREKRMNDSFLKALGTGYLKEMVPKILSIEDSFDKAIVADLYEKVFPIYDEIVKEFGMPELVRHIEYVQDAISKRDGGYDGIYDIAKYLGEIAKNRLARLRIEQTLK